MPMKKMHVVSYAYTSGYPRIACFQGLRNAQNFSETRNGHVETIYYSNLAALKQKLLVRGFTIERCYSIAGAIYASSVKEMA